MRVRVEVVYAPHPPHRVQEALRIAAIRLTSTVDSISVQILATEPPSAVLEFDMPQAAQYKLVGRIYAAVKEAAWDLYEDITIRFPKGRPPRSGDSEGGRPMGKYDPLRSFLERAAPDMSVMQLSFGQIEQILGDKLPDSARQHRPWWGNEFGPSTHSQALSWLAAQWAVDTVDLGHEWVRFRPGQ